MIPKRREPLFPDSAFSQSLLAVRLGAQILKSVKAATEVRNSVSHSAIIFANALMHCGTTVDSFLRDNLDWLSRATNWAKFSATAGLGVIHRGHLAEVPSHNMTVHDISNFSWSSQVHPV